MVKIQKSPGGFLWAIFIWVFIKRITSFSGALGSAGTLATSTVRSTTTLTLTFQIGSMAADEYLLLSFPNSRSYFDITGTSVTWPYTCGSGSATFTCVWDSSARTVKATPGGAYTSCLTGTFQLQDYINNLYTQQEGITGQVFTTGSATPTYTQTAYVDYTAATVSTVTLVPDSLVVGANTPLTVLFQVGAFDLTSSFKVIMTFPRRFYFNTPTTNQGYFEGSITCVNATNNIQVTPTCSFSTATSTGVATVSITNLYSSTIASATTYGFKITNIKNPISTATVSGFTFLIVDPSNDEYKIAEKTSGITLAVTTAKTATIGISPPTTYTVYSQQAVSFTISPGIEVEANWKMTMAIPTDTPWNAALFAFNILSGGGSCTTTQWTSGSWTGTHQSTQSVTLSLNLTAAPQLKTTGSFSYTLTTTGDDSIATGTATIASTSFSTGSITSFVFTHVTSASTVVQETTQWKLGFTLAHALTNPWVITVTYPNSEFTITSWTGPTNLIGFSSGTTWSVSSNTLTIQGSYALSAGTKSFENVVGTNPTAVFNTGSFTVNSYNSISSTNYAVDVYDSSDTSFTNPFQATAQTLTSIAVAVNTPGTNSVTGLTPVQYDFTIGHKSNLLTSYQVRVQVPIAGSGDNCLTMYDASSVNVTSMLIPSAITAAKDNTTPLTFSYNNFKNPRKTTSICQSFTVSITDSSGNALESGTGGSITITTANTLSSFSITPNPTNLVNGGSAEYTIASTANSNTPLIVGDKYIITFPSDISIASATMWSACARVSSTVLTYTVATAGTSISFSVSGIIVQSSTRPVSTAVSVSVVASTSDTHVISTHSSTTIPTTSVAGTLTSPGLTQGSSVANTATTYTFTFTLANKIPAGGVFVIENTPTLTFAFDATIGCGAGAVGDLGQCTDSSGTVVVPVVNELPASRTVTVSVGNYTNPTTPTSTSFTIRTYADSGRTYIIDQVATGMVPSLECNYPCKTCQVADKSACLSCFTTITSIPEKYHTSTANTCTSSCATDHTANSTDFTCTACNTNWATCVTGGAANAARCATWSAGRFLYSENCYDSWADVTAKPTYTSGSTCVDWDSTCNTCSGSSATNCLSCTGSLNLNTATNQCTSTWPTNTVAISNRCETCTNNCAEWSVSTSNCTACSSPNKILHQNQCLASCPTGTIANSTGDGCDSCTGNWATWSGTTSTWLTCIGSLLLEGVTCQASCSSGRTNITNECLLWIGWENWSGSQTTCTSCTSPTMLHNSAWVNPCPTGYQANTAGTAWEVSPTDTPTEPTNTTNTTTTTSSNSYNIVPFPFLIFALFLLIVAIIGWVKDPRSLIATSFIAFLSILQFIYYCTQIFHAYWKSETQVLMLTVLALLGLVLWNILMSLIFCWIVCRNNNFKSWSSSYKKTRCWIQFFGLVVNFKFLKLYYSCFFGMEHFWAGFDNIMRFINYMTFMWVIHIIWSIIPCLAADALGLMSLTWGTQLYITLIETAILEVIMILFLIYEFCNTRKLNERGEYAKVNVEPNMSKLEEIDESSEKIEQKMRQEALKKIIEMMKGNKGIGMNNNIEDCIDDDDRFKRRNSLPAYGNPIEELSDRPRSYPLSPRARREIEDPLINPLALGFDRDDDFWVPQDNVYAESKPPNPLGKIGKSYKDGDTQTFMVGGDHDIPFRDDDSDDSRPARHGRKPGRGRGRRGRLEDKIIEENQYLDQDSDAVDDEELDVIKEEDDIGATYGSPKKLQKGLNKNLIDEEELRRKIAEEDNQFLEEEKKLAEKEGEDNLIKEAEEELSKSKIGFNSPPSASDKSNLLNDTDVKIVPVPLNSSTTNIDGMQIPPSAEKRTFNENDIKGDLEPNHEGVIAPVALPNGNLVDKYGRRVNEKGYLIDENGNVIDTKTEKEMFNKDKLDARGDIPQPFNLERYNFNPHDITGAFAVGKNGKPILQETPDGKLADDSGKQVNEKGILIDEDGNVTDKYGRKKLDKDQLTNKGDLPPMLNYSGKQYKVFDVMGRYDKDPRGDIILERNEKGQIVDKKGRRCNDKGYLTDPDGNIVDNKGNRIWDKEHLYEGEFPKIFPFSLFNPDTIKGNFKRDKDGKPILKPAEKPGQFYDDDGNLVNKHGYLIDPDGNIIDKNGNIVFKKDILKDGEIPPVFRNGMIRQNSSSSLSKLMSEIDKEQDSDLDILKDFDEEEKGNTSVDSLMEDTPSNYNIANQRFDRPKYKKEPEEKYNEEEEYYDDSENDYDEGEEDEDDDDDDDNDSITGPAGVPILNARQPRGKILKKKKKKKRRRRKKPKQEYEDPTAADYAMAKAYGGEAKGRPARKYKRKMSGRSTSSRASRGFSRPARRDKIFKGAGSVSGRDNDQLRTLRSEHSKGGLGKTGLTSKKFNKKRGPISKASNQDFDKVYDRKLDEFLENSSYEFESLGPPSRAMSRQGSAKGDHKLKGLESIYLQRLEANPTKNKKKKKRGRKDGEFMGSELSEQDDLAGLIEDNYKKMKKKFAPASARKRGRSQAPESNQPNIFTGNFDKYAKDKKLDVGENF